jgi:hypothetical protein
MGQQYPPPKHPPKSRLRKISDGIMWGLLGFCVIAGVIVLVPVFISAKVAEEKTRGISTVKQIGVAVNLYLVDFDDRFPLAANWEDEARKYTIDPKIFEPAARRSPSIAFNRALVGFNAMEVDLPQSTVMVFESVLPGPNAVGGARDIFRYQEHSFICAATDSSTKMRRLTNAADLQWEPKAAP